jgi:hypothetical protein
MYLCSNLLNFLDLLRPPCPLHRRDCTEGMELAGRLKVWEKASINCQYQKMKKKIICSFWLCRFVRITSPKCIIFSILFSLFVFLLHQSLPRMQLQLKISQFEVLLLQLESTSIISAAGHAQRKGGQVSFFFLLTTFIPRNNEPFATLDPGLKMREHICFRYRKLYPTIQCKCSGSVT